MDVIRRIEQESVDLKKTADQVLQLTCQYSQESEVSIIKTRGITVSTRYGEIESIEFNNNEVLEVTVFLNNKKGTACSNNLDKNDIINTVNTAVNISRYTFSDIYSGIADNQLLAFSPIFLDLCHPIELSVKLCVELTSKSEKIALKYDPRIIATEGSRFHAYTKTNVFGNSHGMLQSYSESKYSLFCNVVAENNGIMEQNYAYTLSRVFKKLHSPEWVGEECARRTLNKLGSKKIKTMESSVLFSSEVAVSLFKHLAVSIHGSAVWRKSTFLLHKLEKKIFPTWLSIRELPHVPQELGSSPFDNEGIQTLNKFIVKNGILRNWLLDTYSAKKLGLNSTGNAGGIFNWYVSCQDISFMELVKNMYHGLIITELMGQGVNIVTGDYSRGVSGFWVENGIIKYPVHEITVSGNLKEMFSRIVSISNDIETRSSIRSGSVLIESMQISGI